MHVIVTGANGFLGQHLCKHLKAQDINVTALGRGPARIPASLGIPYASVDLTDAQAVQAFFQQTRADAVVHTAAMSKPDECHQNRAAAWLQNVTATEYLLQAVRAAQPSMYVVYTSTDFIFGEGGPHAEDDAPAPLNYYGETKLEAEKRVGASGLACAIMRPVFMYGETWPGLRPSFLHWVQQNLQAGKPIKVVCDQRRTPTYVGDVCKGLESLLRRRAPGTWHLAGAEIVSPYDMALATAEALALDSSLIEKVTADSFPEPVRRALRSGLRIGKAREELGYSPLSLREGIIKTFGLEEAERVEAAGNAFNR